MATRSIADSYWVKPGRLMAGEYPGARTEDQACAKLGGLLDEGVTLFVDLTEEDEYQLRPDRPTVEDLARQRDVNVEHTRWPIPDMNIPSHPTMQSILDLIDHAVAQGKCVYIHCFGGIGRTGTVVGCHLVRHGMNGEQALAEITRLRAGTPDRYRRSPETDAQRTMVLKWREETNA